MASTGQSDNQCSSAVHHMFTCSPAGLQIVFASHWRYIEPIVIARRVRGRELNHVSTEVFHLLCGPLSDGPPCLEIQSETIGIRFANETSIKPTAFVGLQAEVGATQVQPIPRTCVHGDLHACGELLKTWCMCRHTPQVKLLHKVCYSASVQAAWCCRPYYVLGTAITSNAPSIVRVIACEITHLRTCEELEVVLVESNAIGQCAQDNLRHLHRCSDQGRPAICRGDFPKGIDIVVNYTHLCCLLCG